MTSQNYFHIVLLRSYFGMGRLFWNCYI